MSTIFELNAWKRNMCDSMINDSTQICFCENRHDHCVHCGEANIHNGKQSHGPWIQEKPHDSSPPRARFRRFLWKWSPTLLSNCLKFEEYIQKLQSFKFCKQKTYTPTILKLLFVLQTYSRAGAHKCAWYLVTAGEASGSRPEESTWFGDAKLKHFESRLHRPLFSHRLHRI
jgi:hypothetical protein